MAKMAMFMGSMLPPGATPPPNYTPAQQAAFFQSYAMAMLKAQGNAQKVFEERLRAKIAADKAGKTADLLHLRRRVKSICGNASCK